MYNANYMDGVPVKIAEKYKPPPTIYNIPQSLANKINLDDNFYWNCPLFTCDTELEKNTLTKIEQWKHIRQHTKEQRRERKLRKEQQRHREYEDRQKNMLCSVSYPSADDLSSEEEEKGMVFERNGSGILKSKETSHQIRAEKTVNCFHNILQPTVLSSKNSSNANSSQTTLMFKSTLESEIANSFNYKDFEDDTSSPFDNIELKTINDLDVLAQVLHNTQIKSVENENIENEAEISNESSNNSEHEQIVTDNIPNHKISLPRFNCDFNAPQQTLTPLRDSNLFTSHVKHSKANLSISSLTPLHTINDLSNSNGCYNNQSFYCKQSTNQVDLVTPQPCDRQQKLIDDQTKSKSVPDILRELRNEVRKSETKRYRNCSCNMEDTSEHKDLCLINKTAAETNEDLFGELDSKAKQLVEQVSAMGFPYTRVARIVQLLGADDKKVVEHLIPLSELADLGFEESKISEALIRNENNKNKALDDLIS